ncbi:phospho-sugar mutase [Kineosporia sp. A_224]|uniref:phospho-sugar mutase n=1 Tax=Kineosporia sp. A_224 TaxID=1962180 RepID=UPI001E3A83AE|nr:phospho-sugar mutase [Kineosporia sp. A_224]
MDDVELDRLVALAGAWRDDDPDPRTRAALDDLVARAVTGGADAPAAREELADAFAGPLEFGTAGLRGALGPGPNRMNRSVVIRAAAGLAAYLRATVPGQPHVVVGYDARTDSDVFARDTCAVMSAAGVTATVLPRPLPTPVLAYCVRAFDADAGVMVTASHNPPQDNGYKVYLGGRADTSPGRGAQIVPPADAGIAAAIAAAGPVLGVPLDGDGWTTLDDGVVDAYLDALTTGAQAVVRPGGARDLDVVLTPLHGVGGDTCSRALVGAGFAAPYVVPEQALPDPAFPTVAFPNPEEPGAVDLAVAAASRRGADLVVANDPDADRCAVAVPDPALPPLADGRPAWRMLRGDELGALLADHVLSRDGDRLPDGAVVACSIVSSQLLARIAADHGVRHAETLTGFKWISRVDGLVYGYEEALGYCVAPDLVRDKDGISAALVVCELAAALKASGRTLLDALDDLARRHGVHATDQLSVRVTDLALIADAMARLRATPPATLGGRPVVEAVDLAAGGAGLPPTDGLRYRTDGGVRVVVRPSGTEPKLKCYLEAVVPVGDDDPDGDDPAGGLAAARAQARTTLDAVRADLSAALALG